MSRTETGEFRAPTADTQISSMNGSEQMELHSRACQLARRYLNSNPGDDTLGRNRWVATRSQRLLAPKLWGYLEKDEIPDLEKRLSWRFQEVDKAERIVREIGLNIVPIAEWDWEAWPARNIEGENPKYSKEVFNRNFGEIKGWELAPVPEGGPHNVHAGFLKPQQYLAAAFLVGETTPIMEHKSLKLPRTNCDDAGTEVPLPECLLLPTLCPTQAAHLRLRSA